MTISTVLEVVTPSVAQKHLAKNMKNNRKLNMTKVSQITKDMRDGKWMETGDPIRFDANGEMIDGQHRLTGVINSGITLTMVVVRGCKPEVRNVIDIGTRRTPADILHMSGIKSNSALKAAVARLAFGISNGQTGKSTDSGSGNIRINNEEMVKWVKDNETELEHSIKVGSRLYKWWGAGSLAGIVYTHMALSRLDKTKADKFYDELSTGIGSGTKSGKGFDPRTALAKTLEGIRKASTSKSGNACTYVYLISFAYEAWKNDKLVPASIPFLDRKTDEGLPFPVSIKGWWV